MENFTIKKYFNGRCPTYKLKDTKANTERKMIFRDKTTELNQFSHKLDTHAIGMFFYACISVCIQDHLEDYIFATSRSLNFFKFNGSAVELKTNSVNNESSQKNPT